MYCNHCGKNEPEIKLNDKSFCSVCGLPPDDIHIVSQDTSTNDKSDKKKELSSAFSQLGSSMDDNAGGFYRSKDVRVVPRVSGNTKQRVDERSKKEHKTTKPKAVDIPKEDASSHEPRSGIDKPVDIPILKVTEEDKRVEDEILAKISGIPVTKRDKGTRTEETTGKKTTKDEDMQTSKTPIDPGLGVKDIKTDTQEIKSNEFRKAVKEVDKLGSASKLLDILEDEAVEKELDRKEVKAKKLEGTFGKLIDILNQPVKSPEPTKHQKARKKDIHKDQIKKNYEELLAQKELQSPLDDLEIEGADIATSEVEKPVETTKSFDLNDKRMDKDEVWPIFEDKKPGEPNKQEMGAGDKLETKPSIANEEKKPSIPDEVKDEIKETLKEIEDEPVSSSQKVETLNLTDKKNISDEEHEKIEEDIHSFGDKKNHIDHWPEEEIKKNDTEILDEEHHNVLSDFMKVLVHENPKDKKKEKRGKNKSKKNKSKKLSKEKKTRKGSSRLMLVLSAFIGSTIVIGGAFYYFAYLYDTQETKKELMDLSGSITFNVKYPTYVPVGYEKQLQEAKNSSKAIIVYSYVAEVNDTLSLTEEFIVNSDLDIKLYAENNSDSYKTKDLDNNTFYELDDDKITWIENDIWFILEKTGDLETEELLKIAKSI